MASTPSQLDSQQIRRPPSAEPKTAAGRLLTWPTSPRDWRETQAADCGRKAAKSWKSVQRNQFHKRGGAALVERWRRAEASLEGLFQTLAEMGKREADVPKDGLRVADYEVLLRLALRDSGKAIADRRALPQVHNLDGETVPRALDAMAGYLRAVHYELSDATLLAFLGAAQEDWPWQFAEFWMLPALAQLALLESAGMIWRATLLTRGFHSRADLRVFDAIIASLRNCMELDWKTLLERLSVTERILREDPAGAYRKMDAESRGQYRQAVATFATQSPRSEAEIARAAIELAQAPAPGLCERARQRRAHVGFYLVDEGRKALWSVIEYRPGLRARAREAILARPTAFYLFFVALITVPVMLLISSLCGHGWLHWFALALALPVALECSVEVCNLFMNMLVHPRRLARLDFSKGIPKESTTMVVVPTLLSDAEQVRQAVKDLEVRYLANRDANLHFGLITDLPDAVEAEDEKDRLVPLCVQLIEDLNQRYAGQPFGGFFLFHRPRIFNPVERIWMGWERKRGKLLDFNNLLLGKRDRFPVQVGDLSVLSRTKYVITLDLDTQLPRDSAQALVGTLAHPLHRAVIDPVTNKVVEGYGILQPRVGVSIKSTVKSRLAALYSGDTGFDIYTRAVSNVYQDLFGEAIFAGKGIYEVETFQRVLEYRFPSNAILSHDLIEGEYARTGLLSDVEVTDDYPSHVAAYSRRKHRWIRGDWQIVLWLLPSVPNYFGTTVRNRLGMISKWKIVDNLRRSLSEPATFLLLVCGWIFLPVRAASWTLWVLTLITFPTGLQTVLSMVRSGRSVFTLSYWKNMVGDTVQAYERLLFRLSLLCHQSLVMLDAVVRTLIRMGFTHKRLLQWETAAKAEQERAAQDPVETYLGWQPYLAALTGMLIAAVRPWSLLPALPFLLLWGCSSAICRWLNRPEHPSEARLAAEEEKDLRRQSLATWRFFRDFSTAEENWLIPDIVQETPAQMAHKISPSNLGLLLNARMAAYDLGFITLPEFAGLTEATLRTAERMPKCRGHFYNWYENATLEPVAPQFVSAVDSGNLVCCLWALKQGCLEAGRDVLIRPAMRRGLVDHLEMVKQLLGESEAEGALLGEIRAMQRQAEAFVNEGDCLALSSLREKAAALQSWIGDPAVPARARWWLGELQERINTMEDAVADFLPWLLPEFAGVCKEAGIDSRFSPSDLTLEKLPVAQSAMCGTLCDLLLNPKSADKDHAAAILLISLLAKSRGLALALADKLRGLAAVSHELAAQMDFRFLYDADKDLLSIGYDPSKNSRTAHCYDMLASEARVATFVAVAKGEVPQKSWFKLARHLSAYRAQSLLLSWSGTMFEYLLPHLWMRSYPNTLLDHSARAAVRAQRDFGEEHAIPWGISESSCRERSPDGFYYYLGFGVPAVAINAENTGKPVVSPYSTFLALAVDPQAAAENLRRMEQTGMLGDYGFYEACDFRSAGADGSGQGEIIRCWMAHHQGMSLVAAANALCDASMIRRFHAESMVAATERLLHEKCPRVVATELPRLRLGPLALKASLTRAVEKAGASA